MGDLEKIGDNPIVAWREQWEARWPGRILRVSQREIGDLLYLAGRLGNDEISVRMARYLADESAWLVERLHPLGVLLKQIERYGPPPPKPKSAMQRASEKFLAGGTS